MTEVLPTKHQREVRLGARQKRMLAYINAHGPEVRLVNLAGGFGGVAHAMRTARSLEALGVTRRGLFTWRWSITAAGRKALAKAHPKEDDV